MKNKLLFLSVLFIVCLYVSTTVAKGQTSVHYIVLNGVPDTETGFAQIASTFGKASGREIPVGIGFIISVLDATPEETSNRLHNYLTLSEKYDIPVLVQLDAEQWWRNRPDLWNWWDKDKPGYNPENRNNVEWTSWTPDSAVKIGWRNWGSQIRVLPMPNLMSPAYRAAAREGLRNLMPIVVQWYNQLPEDKRYLLIGMKLGWESAIGVNNWYYPNGNSYLDKPVKNDPTYGLNTDQLPGRGVTAIGYAAVKTAKIAQSGKLTEKMQAEVVRRHLDDWCKMASDLGMPRNRLFTHVGSWTKGENHYYAALNKYSCPGWSFYKHAPNPKQDVTAMDALKKSDAPYWAATEWLFMGESTYRNWVSSLRKTIEEANARYVCIYNWNGIKSKTGAIEAIQEVSKAPERGYTAFVDPFIGADGGGYTFPGPAMPSGMVKVGPDCNKLTENAGWDPLGNIVGFSHTHINGSGGGCKYGNILLMSTTGSVKPLDYSSPRANENAEVGLYSVDLTRYNTKVRLSASQRAAIHEYTFPGTDSANVLIDLGSFLSSYERQEFVGSEVRILSDTEVEGYSRIRGGWNIGRAYTVYFYARFENPAVSKGTWKSGKLFPREKSQYDSNEKTGAYFTFNTKTNKKVRVKVGISYMGTNKARFNAEEIGTWDLDDVKINAVNEWNKILSQIKIDGGSEENKKVFYSSFYRIFLQPTNYTRENPLWISDKPYYGDYHAIWDTYRATHPFISLLRPSLEADMVESLVDIYRFDNYMPDARTSHDNGRVQGGTNCDMLVTEAFLKGVKGIDYKTALEAMLKNATVPPGDDERKQGRGGLWDYNRIGYVSTSFERCGTRTLEYSANDYAIATLAKGLGDNKNFEKFTKKASSWENMWNPEIESMGFKGFIWPRNADGSWLKDDNFTLFSSGSLEHPFYETFSWEYSFYAPHDMKQLISRMGSAQIFSDRLDTYFTKSFPGKREQLLFYTKMVGMCQISNEPSFLTPSLYCYINQPWKTARIVRQIMATQYHSGRDGVPGNDDSGSMGAWYAFHALGFYPNAGQDIYLISSPMFPKATITLENGKQVVITARNAGEKNIFIQSCLLNGQPFNNCWFRHSDIANGANFEFVMGDKPSEWAMNGVLPPSMSD
jgi:predicted alpha-1,2-mannosidase